MLLAHLCERELSLDARPARRSELRSTLRIGEQRCKRVCECGVVAGRHELARLAHQLGNAADELATTGRPAAIASSTESGRPSDADESTNTSEFASSEPTSSRSPSNSTGAWPSSRSTTSRSGPSPTITPRKLRGSRRANARASVTNVFGSFSRPTLITTGGSPASADCAAPDASTPFRMTTVRSRVQVRARRPASSSVWETQMIDVVSGLIARSAARYAFAARPESALNAQPWTVKIRTGTRASAAASRPSTPAFELFAWTMCGRTRR